MIEVIRKPEMTKKTSTPRYPPGRAFSLMWKRITGRTANARKPSISGRYAIPAMATHNSKCDTLERSEFRTLYNLTTIVGPSWIKRGSVWAMFLNKPLGCKFKSYASLSCGVWASSSPINPRDWATVSADSSLVHSDHSPVERRRNAGAGRH